MPGSAHTCPGETTTCKNLCYAKKGFYYTSSVKEFLEQNTAAIDKPDFVRKMTDAIKANRVKLLRIHVAGDFVSAEYISKWIQIAKNNPRTKFFCYTRSWQPHLDMWSSILKLAKLSNVTVWLSADKDTATPPKSKFIKVAYLATSDADIPDYPTNLIFRNNKKTVAKSLGGVQVCPPENGIKTKLPITCSSCGLCWKNSSQTLHSLTKKKLKHVTC